jgi:hypothetical protein
VILLKVETRYICGSIGFNNHPSQFEQKTKQNKTKEKTFYRAVAWTMTCTMSFYRASVWVINSGTQMHMMMINSRLSRRRGQTKGPVFHGGTIIPQFSMGVLTVFFFFLRINDKGRLIKKKYNVITLRI